jgi:hypothetical protein
MPKQELICSGSPPAFLESFAQVCGEVMSTEAVDADLFRAFSDNSPDPPVAQALILRSVADGPANEMTLEAWLVR